MFIIALIRRIATVYDDDDDDRHIDVKNTLSIISAAGEITRSTWRGIISPSPLLFTHINLVGYCTKKKEKQISRVIAFPRLLIYNLIITHNTFSECILYACISPSAMLLCYVVCTK